MAENITFQKNGEYANQTFVILPTDNHGRLTTLAEKLAAQDIEMFTNSQPLNVGPHPSTISEKRLKIMSFLLEA